MSTRLRALTFGCLALLLASLPPALAGKQNEVYTLTQNGLLFGKMNVWLAPNLVRLDFLDNGISTIFSSNSHILILNREKKNFFETDLAHWQGFVTGRAASLECPDFRTCTWTKVGTEKIGGLTVEKDVLCRGKTQDRSGRAYYFFTGVPMNIACRKALAVDPPMPVFPGFPVKTLMNDYTPGKTLIGLDTKSSAKCPMRQDIFAVPHDYKRAKSETEVEKTPAYANVLDDVRSMPARHR